MKVINSPKSAIKMVYINYNYIYFIGDIMQTKRRLKPSVVRYLYKILIVIIITLIMLILMKASSSFKSKFYKYVYDTSFKFTSVNNLYHKYFNSIIDKKDNLKVVSSEKINYSNIEKYNDGAKLTVGNNYAIPIQESGIVVFIGEKDGYNKTIIVQQNNGIDMWYGNISNSNVKLYDYVTKGNIIGSCNNYLYVVFKKNGNIVPYEENL